MAIIIVVIDMIVIIIWVISMNLFTYMQKQFSKSFDNHTVEARDFTIMIHKLPKKYSKLTNELSVKFSLWQEI